MALNIKNRDVEALLSAIVAVTGETKTEAVRKALVERRQRLKLQFETGQNKQYLMEFLEENIWPYIPKEVFGTQLSKAEEEKILGYGEFGV